MKFCFEPGANGRNDQEIARSQFEQQGHESKVDVDEVNCTGSG